VSAWWVRLPLLWLVSLGAACTSAPIRYYTLTPPTDETPRGSPATAAIDFRMVQIPPELDRADLLVRAGPTQITLLENERWASPLKDEIKESLRLELQRRLSPASYRSFARLTLEIDVQRFEAELGRYAHLEASWRASLSGGGPPSSAEKIANCAFRADEPIPASYAGMVEGYQRAIAAFADAIVAALTSSAGGKDASCGTTIRD
jgi:uncharacterized protein